MAVKGFVYRGKDRTTEDVKRAATMSTGNYDSMIQDGFPTFKVKEGDNTIRVFPPTWPKEEEEVWGKNWAIIVSVHNNIGVDRGSFLCLEAMKDEPCPICEMRRQTTDDDDRFALSPNKRAICWIINRDDEGAGPLLWSMPIKQVFKVINARSVDRKSGALVLIDDPDEGYDVFINCENAGKKNATYSGVEVDRDPSNLGDAEKDQDRWMKYVIENPLPDVLLWPEPDYMEKALTGQVSKRAQAEEDEATEEEGGSRRGGRSAPRGRGRGEEEGREQAPRSARRNGRGDPPEEDETPLEEEEGTTEAEGDPEPPPPRSRRGRPEPAPRRTARQRPEPEPAPESEGDPEPPRRTSRRAPPADEDPAPSRQARGSLERLRPPSRR